MKYQPSQELIAQGTELAKKLGKEKLFVNDKGEFFTHHNHAMLSVGHNADRLAELNFTHSIAIDTTSTGEGEEATGDGTGTNGAAPETSELTPQQKAAATRAANKAKADEVKAAEGSTNEGAGTETPAQ